MWRGDVVWTIDWISVSFVAVGPLVAGFAAIDTARLSVGSEYLAGQRFWRTPGFAVGLSYAIGIGAVHLLVLAGALGISFYPSFRLGAGWVWDPSTIVAILAQLSMIAFFAALGSLMGRFLRPVLGGISAALASFACVYAFGTPGGSMSLLDSGVATVPRVGYAYSATFLTIQVLFLLAVTIALHAIRPAGAVGSSRPRGGDAAIAGLVVAAVTVGTSFAPVERLEPVAAQPDYCASVIGVPTCYYRQHARVSKAFQDVLWTAFGAAQDSGYGALVPARVAEASRTILPAAVDPGVGTVFISSDHLSGLRPTTWEVVQGLVEPVHCPQVRGELPPSERYWSDLLALTATWVDLVEPGQGEANGFVGDPLSPTAAAALLDEFRTCTYAFQ